MPSKSLIFISHAHRNRSIANSLADALVGIGVPRTHIRQTSATDTGFPLGDNWKNTLITDIKEAKLLLPIVTPQFEESPTCQTEVGIALASKIRIIPIVFSSRSIKRGFLHDIESVERTPESLSKLFETVVDSFAIESKSSTTAATMAHQFIEKTDVLPDVDVMFRGDLINDVNIIDATFYLQEKEDRVPQRKMIEECLKFNRLIPEQFQYSTPAGAKRWINLCNDRAYTTYTDSIQFLLDNLDELLDVIGQEIIQSVPDYISLGPGNGAKDILILEGMLRREVELGSPARQWFFYPYDISMFLLCQSIIDATTNDLIRQRIKIKAICAQFDKLSDFRPVFDYRPEPNIFSFLGNTLGNMSRELEFLSIVHSTMNDEDLLILEVRLQDEMDPNNPGGSEEVRKRFNFSPLEFLDIPFVSAKLMYDIREPALSQIPGTKTLQGTYTSFTYKQKDISQANLCCINHYDIEQLETALNNSGFLVRWRKKSSDAKTGMIVLKKQE